MRETGPQWMLCSVPSHTASKVSADERAAENRTPTLKLPQQTHHPRVSDPLLQFDHFQAEAFFLAAFRRARKGRTGDSREGHPAGLDRKRRVARSMLHIALWSQLVHGDFDPDSKRCLCAMIDRRRARTLPFLYFKLPKSCGRDFHGAETAFSRLQSIRGLSAFVMCRIYRGIQYHSLLFVH